MRTDVFKQKYQNRIAKEVCNPLTDESSDFFVPADKRTIYIRKQLNKEKRTNPLYKRAKYIFVYKHRESEHTYRIRGTNRRTRYYGIAILTDDNNFYYNEYRTKHTVLSMLTAGNMCRIFTDGYIIDNQTKITVDNRISINSEPVMIFLYILARSVGIPVNRRGIENILNTLNHQTHNIVKIKNGDKKLSLYHKQHLLNGLLKKGWLDFLPDHLMKRMLDKENEPIGKRNLIFYCAAGILYMFRRDALCCKSTK